MRNLPPPATFTNEELCRYANLALAGKESLPLSWQEELVKRMEHMTERTHAQLSRSPSHAD